MNFGNWNKHFIALAVFAALCIITQGLVTFVFFILSLPINGFLMFLAAKVGITNVNILGYLTPFVAVGLFFLAMMVEDERPGLSKVAGLVALYFGLLSIAMANLKFGPIAQGLHGIGK